MTITTMLPELVLRSPEADWDHVTPDAELASPTLPIRAPIAGFFAGAPDTTL